jgi:hypothetical protein
LGERLRQWAGHWGFAFHSHGFIGGPVNPYREMIFASYEEMVRANLRRDFFHARVFKVGVEYLAQKYVEFEFAKNAFSQMTRVCNNAWASKWSRVSDK